MYCKCMKRVIDFTLSLMGIIVLSPIFLILSIMIKIDSKGPVLFKQKRVKIRYAGIGIKAMLDVWVYLKKYSDVMDWKYINSCLKEHDFAEIESNVKKLAWQWFDLKECNEPAIKELADYIAANGAFATKSQLNKSVAIEQNSVKHFARMFFLPYKEMALKYKILKPMPFLLPAMWVYRAGYSLAKKDTIKKEG